MVVRGRSRAIPVLETVDVKTHHRQVHDATRDMLDIGNPAPHGD